MAPRVYLDWNAGAPPSRAVRRAVAEALEVGGNPSSIHAEGRAARAIVERARKKLADRFGVAPEAVTFTSGGTEANMMALAPGVRRSGGRPVERLVVSEIEHPSVLRGGRFREVELIGADGHGHVDPGGFTAASDLPVLYSLMAANNETGVVQPLDVARPQTGHAPGSDAVLHTDAAQAFGRIPDEMLMGDLVTLSGHKFGAPKGVGALIRRNGVEVPALLLGGGQERGARGGTENVAAIAGLAAALDEPAADPAAWAETAEAREKFEAALVDSFPRVTIFGREANRLPNTTLFSLGVPAELLLIALDLEGMAVSSGSACSSGKVAPSHVLAAMGVPAAVAAGAIRVSVGPVGAAEAYARFLVALRKVVVPMGLRPT